LWAAAAAAAVEEEVTNEVESVVEEMPPGLRRVNRRN